MNRAASRLGRMLPTLLVAAAAIASVGLLWRRYERAPWTSDAELAADSIGVSPDVSGQVTRVLATDNQFVRAGAVLFLVDGDRYAARLEQAAARVDRAKAGRGPGAAADLRLALADRAIARLDADRSDVRAQVDGYITGLTLHPGQYVQRGQEQFTLVVASSFHVVGRFEEAKLRGIEVGDRARIDVLGEPRPLWGHVESLAARTDGTIRADARSGFSWVRAARRVRVRIAIDQAPADMRPIAGRTASVRLLPTRPLYGN